MVRDFHVERCMLMGATRASYPLSAVLRLLARQQILYPRWRQDSRRRTKVVLGPD
jgi:hypothetical protein